MFRFWEKGAKANFRQPRAGERKKKTGETRATPPTGRARALLRPRQRGPKEIQLSTPERTEKRNCKELHRSSAGEFPKKTQSERGAGISRPKKRGRSENLRSGSEKEKGFTKQERSRRKGGGGGGDPEKNSKGEITRPLLRMRRKRP